MPYVPTNWQNEVLNGAERYNLLDNGGLPIYSNVQLPLITPITQAGTPVDADKMNHLESEVERLSRNVRDAASEITINNDTITITASHHKLQPQSGTSDNLSTINGTTAGQMGILYISDYGTDTIIIQHNVGNILCSNGEDIILSYGALFWYSDGVKIIVASPARKSITNYSTTSQGFTAGVKTYITGSMLQVPQTRLKIGSIFRWKFNYVKTAAGIAASTFNVVVGTLGTAGDTNRLTFTKPAGTAVADDGEIEIEVIVRGPISNSCIIVGHFTMTHNLVATGHATIPVVTVTNVSSAFDVLIDDLKFGICITPGSADITSTDMVISELLNL